MENQNITPFEATHPGTLIQDELEFREDLNQTELAKLLDVKRSFLNELIKGKRPITAKTAILLEKVFGINAKYWLDFQSQYDIDHARIQEKNIAKVKNIEIWDMIKNYIPEKFLKKLNLITDNLEKDIKTVFDIFDVNSIDDLINSFAKNKLVYYKKSDALNTDEKNLITWQCLAIYQAKKIKVKKYDPTKINELKKELNRIFYKNNDTINQVEKTLNKYGIKFLILEKLEKTPVDGIAFWNNSNPTIALTIRHKRLDNFAFTIMHELGHIELHLKDNKDRIIYDKKNNKHTKEEQEANNYSRDSLINKEYWSFFYKGNIHYQDFEVNKFSKEIKVHPSIILGRICHESDNYKRRTKISKNIN
ncbi:HigA family addiction module antitoxin [Flammeovirga pacifica]|uniref:Addiction module antidote protein, HigA family n=1 Tax=Flammeovirga pacifica TaxID=915059 RepID=A0A1S1Z0F4_FLAPC|nr:HigA family addiction module antitoxin [Flammeovirga pacifica]OHX66732.1 addiction module antidote protein, HigA family [Flammeovirga pacifica]